ncbi:hypothetical protein VIBNISOn1_1840063 [Vibrio nigripulchritudo SOn1]|uniref:Uncharacterized protein n=1 Tax=Vibrio nigripulchritudo SOn1 TaxID=1238450 RepID=A0AAV2VPM5_9VIBR|nr:hypothetical protein VIBNISOn1_1840063 [Vibrio nigripulchritudo SOn1]
MPTKSASVLLIRNARITISCYCKGPEGYRGRLRALNSEPLALPNKTKPLTIFLDPYPHLDEMFLSIYLKIRRDLFLLFLYLIGYKMAY